MTNPRPNTPSERKISDLIAPNLAAEVRRIELQTRRSVRSEMLGQYRSAFRGNGLIFSELRAYEPGDEIKKIHWKATARTGKVQVKSYDEERHLNVVVAVDLSPSTIFGGARTNGAKALEFAALIAILARTNGDSLGLCLFGDRVVHYTPPRRARTQTERILLSLLEAEPVTGSTDVGGALRFIHERQRRPAIVFVASDFIAPPFGSDLAALAARHDVVCVALRDRLDSALPSAGLVSFCDPESGAVSDVDTSSLEVQAALKRAQDLRISGVRAACDRAGAALIEIDADPLTPLAQLMNRRAARGR